MVLPKRIIALVDMDCFYVQVAQRKNPSLKGKPCAVVQYNAWQGGGIIAVGYEARKFGVTRQMRGNQAKEKCPEIVLVPVPENRGKADLTQFREAGAEVIEVLAQFTDCLERASIDEAYMDLTNKINQSMGNYSIADIALRTFKTTHIVGIDNKELNFTTDNDILQCDLFKQWVNVLENDEESYRLAIGAIIADDMRKAVLQKTGFSCSAGIGHNKMLAKLVAGFHKPNQQTLITSPYVPEMFETAKIKKVRSLGGKVGAQLQEKLNVEHMSELVKFSLQELQSIVGMKNGELVFWLCRGVDNEPVRVRQLPKSVGCSKNFRGIAKLKTKSEIHKWVTSLAEEVIERLDKEKKQNNRVATLFTVGCLNELNQSQSRRCAVFRATVSHLRDEAFRALSEFNKATTPNDWNPALINLSLNASKFQTISSQGSKAITSYMCSETTSNTLSGTHSLVTKSLESKSVKDDDKSNIFNSLGPGSSTMNSNDRFRDYFVKNAVKDSRTETRPLVSTHSKKASPRECCSSFESQKVKCRQPEEVRGCLPESPLTVRRAEAKIGNRCDNLFSRFCRSVSPDVSANHDYFDKEENIVTSDKEDKEGKYTFLTADNSDENVDTSVLIKAQVNASNKILEHHTSTINDLMICERCGKRVLAWDLPDHMDFHFAKDLQDSMRNNFLNMYNDKPHQTVSPPKKKRQSENSLAKYFSPVKKL